MPSRTPQAVLTLGGGCEQRRWRVPPSAELNFSHSRSSSGEGFAVIAHTAGGRGGNPMAWSGHVEWGPLPWEMGTAGAASASPASPAWMHHWAASLSPPNARIGTQRHPLHPELCQGGSTAAPSFMSPSTPLQDVPSHHHAEPPRHITRHCYPSRWVGKELTC